jgi:hypothetical protein
MALFSPNGATDNISQIGGTTITLPAITQDMQSFTVTTGSPGVVLQANHSWSSKWQIDGEDVVSVKKAITLEDLEQLSKMSLEEAMVHEEPKYRLFAKLLHKWRS